MAGGGNAAGNIIARFMPARHGLCFAQNPLAAIHIEIESLRWSGHRGIGEAQLRAVIFCHCTEAHIIGFLVKGDIRHFVIDQ